MASGRGERMSFRMRDPMHATVQQDIVLCLVKFERAYCEVRFPRGVAAACADSAAIREATDMIARLVAEEANSYDSVMSHLLKKNRMFSGGFLKGTSGSQEGATRTL